jgi:hypothetical protein
MCNILYPEGMMLKVIVFVPVPIAVAIDSNDDGNIGVTLLEAAEAAEVPLAFVAVTVNV